MLHLCNFFSLGRHFRYSVILIVFLCNDCVQNFFCLASGCWPRYNCYLYDGEECKPEQFLFQNNSLQCDYLQHSYPSLLNGSKPCEQKDLDVVLKHEPLEKKNL